jgi:hypothetical protein
MVADTPAQVRCTTFSILFSRYKGDLMEAAKGAAAIDSLKPGDKVLIAEACSHHAIEDDIGRVKIPRWLRQYVGGDLKIDVSSGRDYPDNLKEYKLVIHCGGCMITRREMLSRIEKARQAGVAITNYGLAISVSQGVIKRVLSPFPRRSRLTKDSAIKRKEMKYIDNKDRGALGKGPSPLRRVEDILRKARTLKRLSLERRCPACVEDPSLIKKIFEAALFVKNAIGNRIVLFAPLYISNLCQNQCLYCAFHSGNKEVKRKYLNAGEVRGQVEWLLKRGHKRLLLVAGESGVPGKSPVDYYIESVEAAYSARSGPHYIKRVNINCAPLSVEDFRKLKASNIGTFQLFQETYHDATYRKCHVKGQKAIPTTAWTP